jgi:peptidoglycan/LPS O-acetylase OafA/YrhL
MAKATEIRLRPWFSSPGLLQRIGRVSYSAYLYHVPLLLLIGRAGVAGAIALPLYVALVFGIASISWRYLEPPFAGWHARTKPVGSAEATALAAERSAGP